MMKKAWVVAGAALFASCASLSPIPGEKDRCFFMAGEVPTWLLLRGDRTFSVYFEPDAGRLDEFCHGKWKRHHDGLLMLSHPSWFYHIVGRAIIVDPGGEEWRARLPATREAIAKLMRDKPKDEPFLEAELEALATWTFQSKLTGRIITCHPIRMRRPETDRINLELDLGGIDDYPDDPGKNIIFARLATQTGRTFLCLLEAGSGLPSVENADVARLAIVNDLKSDEFSSKFFLETPKAAFETVLKGAGKWPGP